MFPQNKRKDCEEYEAYSIPCKIYFDISSHYFRTRRKKDPAPDETGDAASG
ncbi:MAG: hypothetical protein L6422_10740 [Candidatus Marinimicrobia bacterium]|nr:hypothetical protein [Candidatus Neomarinimicrobiota bacterium]